MKTGVLLKYFYLFVHPYIIMNCFKFKGCSGLSYAAGTLNSAENCALVKKVSYLLEI